MILVTGGMGFIGVHVAARLLDAGQEVVLTHHRTWRFPKFLESEVGGGPVIETLDLADARRLHEVFQRRRITGVVHLAAPALSVEPAQQFRLALGGLVNILEACHQARVRRVTVASSVAIYSNVTLRPWHEEVGLPVESDSHTAAIKKATEIYSLHFADRTGTDVRILRLASVYGPLYQSMANLPSRLCHGAVRGGPPDLDGIRVGSQYSEATTDLCYVKDCAAGIAAAHMCDALEYRVYNLGGGRAVRNSEVAAAVKQVVPNAHVELPHAQTPTAGDDAYMDISRITADTGYRPAYDIEHGIADYIEWIRTDNAIGSADPSHRPNPLDTTAAAS